MHSWIVIGILQTLIFNEFTLVAGYNFFLSAIAALAIKSLPYPLVFLNSH